MPFPKGQAELLKAGYRFMIKGRCRSPLCNAEIEFWSTPRGVHIPLDKDTLEPHFASCKDVERFRTPKSPRE